MWTCKFHFNVLDTIFLIFYPITFKLQEQPFQILQEVLADHFKDVSIKKKYIQKIISNIQFSRT